jgi:cell division transport system permease protein
MSLQSFDFVVQEVFMNLRRDRVITFATVGIVAVAICILGAATLFLLNLRLITEQVAKELKVTTYLKREITRAQAMALKNEIARWPHVSSAKLITKEEGWEEFKKTHPVAERLSNFPIPWTDAIEVRTDKAENVPAVAERLAGLEESKDLVPTPQEIGARGGVPQKVLRFRRWVNIAALALGALMALAGFLIVHNTTRLSLFARRREIAIMQQVGATPSFVAAPFLVEGAVHGFLGALLACCLLVPTHMYLRAKTAHSGWAMIQLLPDNQVLTIAAEIIAGAMLLGVAGALLSLRRFLSPHFEPEMH